MSRIARSYSTLSGAAEFSSAGAASFVFFDLACFVWASAVTLEKRTARPKMASRVRRNQHLSEIGFQGLDLQTLTNFDPSRGCWFQGLYLQILSSNRTGLLDSYSSFALAANNDPSIT